MYNTKTETPTYPDLTFAHILSHSLALPHTHLPSDDTVICHCLPASPWVIASPYTHLLVALTHPNAREIKRSTEVIKRVNPGCVLHRRPGIMGAGITILSLGQMGSQRSTPSLRLINWGFTFPTKLAWSYSLSLCCVWVVCRLSKNIQSSFKGNSLMHCSVCCKVLLHCYIYIACWLHLGSVHMELRLPVNSFKANLNQYMT